MPLGNAPGALPGPDILLCVIMAWIVRRPDFLPMPLILVIILAEDLILIPRDEYKLPGRGMQIDIKVLSRAKDPIEIG